MLDFSSMRLRRRTLLATAGLVLGGADRLWAAQTNQRASEAQALTDRILTESLAADPVTATGFGEHRYDGQWPDLSVAGLQREQRRVARAIEQLRGFDRTGLDAGSRVDLDTLLNQLELERFVTEAEAPEQRSPLFYTGLIGSGIDDLLSRPFAATEVRATSVAERLEALPAFIEQARVNLRQGPILRPHAQVALQQADGLLTLLVQNDILGRLPDAPPALARRIAAATPTALAAIEKFRSLLKDEWLPKASGDWRLGRANFDRKLQLTLESELTASEVYDLATREHERVRSRMAELARELYAPLFGQAKALPTSDNQVVRQVLAELASDCVAADELRSACESKLAQIATFVEARRLVPQDQSAVLQVIWTPPQKRGVALAGLDSPPPLDSDKPGLPSFYLVQPVPDNWPAEHRASLLREYNNFMLEILSIHEAIPGHFVQGYYARRVPSKVRKVYANGPFVEGWAVYAEHLMTEAGYSGAEPGKNKPAGLSDALWRLKQDPQLRARAIALQGQKFYLRSVTNAILDRAVHAGEMDEAAAVALMVGRSYQQEGEARAKWVRAQVTSTQLSTYFVGYQSWLRLRQQAEARAKKQGQPFDLAGFHAAALSYGAPPVGRLPELLGWT